MSKRKRALVVSGGGSKGAFAGGIVDFLINSKKIDWDCYVGTSTGSLIITLSSLQRTEELFDAYTNISQKTIFSLNPFNKKGKINIFVALWRILSKKLSLGQSDNLYKHIKNMFSEIYYEETKALKKRLFACVTNFTTGEIEYFTNYNTDYETYIKATLASTSVPIFMNPITINDKLYLDGGVMEHVPIQKAIDYGVDEIDVIILRPEKYEKETNKIDNMFEVLSETIDLMQREISYSDAIIGNLEAKMKDIKINFYYTPYTLTKNSLIFNKEQMKKWWEEGYDWARNKDPKTITICKKNETFKTI